MSDEALDLARAKATALAAVARPVPRPRRSSHDYGDGDACPTHPRHGRMWVLSVARQYCGHHEHDRTHTRAFWPLYGLPEAVPPSPLPDIDIGGLTW